MPKEVKKRKNDRNGYTVVNTLPKSVKCVKVSDESYLNRWTAGDGFDSAQDNHSLNDNSDKSSSINSVSSRLNSNNSSKSLKRRETPKNTTQLMTSFRSSNSQMNPKLFLKQRSRYTTCLEEKNVSNFDDNYNDNNDNENQSLPQTETETSDLSQNILDISSPIQQSICDTKISPTSSPNKTQNGEQNVNTFHKSVINYLEDSLKTLNQCLHQNKSNTSLLSRTCKVLKSMKQSRLEFYQMDSLKDISKALTLKLTRIESIFGLTVIHSFVLNDENSEYSEKTPIVLVLNDKITEELDTGCVIRLYPQWTQLRIENRILIINAFNIEIIENTFSDENNEEETDLIIWPKETITA